MSGAMSLELSAVLGFRPQVAAPVSWVSDSDVLFLASARTIVRLDTETHMQRMVTASHDAVAITAFACESGKGCVARSVR
jgi:hypothetical protein